MPCHMFAYTTNFPCYAKWLLYEVLLLMDILPNEVGSHETYYYTTDSHTEVATLQNSASIDTMLIIIYYPV